MTTSISNILLWTIFSMLCGSLPFSMWVSRLFGKNVKAVGDGNPGAINALKAGGWHVGLIAFLLDVSKGAAPVGLAYQIWGWRSWEIFPITLAPLIGSIFSPFLKFRGGKSLSVSLGIWIGLTLWEGPLVILTSLTAAYLIQTVSGWAVMVSIVSLAIYVIFRKGDLVFGWFLGFQTLLLIWTHRNDLRKSPQLRNWLSRK